MKEQAPVHAPATVAEVACGFDILEFAINDPGDEVTLRKSKKSGMAITKIAVDNGEPPLDPKNILLAQCFRLSLDKD